MVKPNPTTTIWSFFYFLSYFQCKHSWVYDALSCQHVPMTDHSTITRCHHTVQHRGIKPAAADSSVEHPSFILEESTLIKKTTRMVQHLVNFQQNGNFDEIFITGCTRGHTDVCCSQGCTKLKSAWGLNFNINFRPDFQAILILSDKAQNVNFIWEIHI